MGREGTDGVTHTYALLEVSRATFEEIACKLRDAGYDHAFIEDGEIDMHGIALAPCDRSPEGGDAKRLRAKHESAVATEGSEAP